MTECASPSLTSVDLAENQLGADGARVLAASLASARLAAPPRRLRRVDLRENYLDEAYAVDGRGVLARTSDYEAEDALKDAVRGLEVEVVL